jgi:sirohydrochlorin cobaltochelatase
MTLNSLPTVLLMGHGSRDSEGAREFLDIADAVGTACKPFPVAAGFLEFAGAFVPSIQDAFLQCIERGVTRFVAIPLLLHEAGHAKRDMPAEIAAVLRAHPHVSLVSIGSIASQPLLLDVVEERIDESGGDSHHGSHLTAVLLVGRGSTDPDANADFYRVGRLLWERRRHLLVECSFISLTEPSVPAGIARCADLGARRILVVPYFMNTGVLVKRISSQVEMARPRYPSVSIEVGLPLGPHPKVVETIRKLAMDLVGCVPASTAEGHR